MRIDTSSKRMIFAVTISDKRVLKTMNRLIHRRAWKRNSQKLNFRFTEFSEIGIAAVQCLWASRTGHTGCFSPEVAGL